MNILFTCGGTAGHVNPAVALARIFQEREPGCRVLFVGADGGMETRLVPKEGYPIETVRITNFHRSLAPADIAHNLGTLRNMYTSQKQARVMVGFEESRSHYDHPEKVVVTGTPVRGDFFRYTRQEAREKLGFTDDRPLLLSYWGSLGAEAMNRRMVDFIAKECYEGAPCRHIHGAGRDFAWMQEELLRRGLKLGDNGVELREYIYDMPLVMAAADVVLCRAGASTISELTAIAKPSILVPSPNVTANHQEKNARVLADQGAAVLLLEKDCQGDALYEQADGLLRDRPRREEMVRALNSMAVPDAGEKIYQTLREVMETRRTK